MTFILGGTIAIGSSHGQRSGLNNPETVLNLRRDKRAGLFEVSTNVKNRGYRLRPSQKDGESPSGLLLEGQFRDYEYRYILTDALLWWGLYDALPIEKELLVFLRKITDISELYNEEGKPDNRLQLARDSLESIDLTENIFLFIALSSGDDDAIKFPPETEFYRGLIQNLKSLYVQFELSAPVAKRHIPGMTDEVVEDMNDLE